jgi:RNA polymerase sigma factor (sigma-70 family)
MTTTADLAEAGALFSAHRDRIYRYIRGMVHDPSEAEDLTQDTFLRAYRHRESLRDPNAVRGWLYRIATHVCLDRLRQRAPQLSIDGEEGARRVEAIRSDSPSALDLAERAETSACVQRCWTFCRTPIAPRSFYMRLTHSPRRRSRNSWA